MKLVVAASMLVPAIAARAPMADLLAIHQRCGDEMTAGGRQLFTARCNSPD